MTDIEIIVSDFDGTLMHDDKTLPKQFGRLLHKLDDRRIRFIAASGRQYYNLRQQLTDELADYVDYIAENGAITVIGNEICTIEEMSAEDIIDVVSAVRAQEGCYAILCGAEGAYYEDDVPELTRHARMYYARLSLVENVLDCIANDQICKIAIFNSHHAEEVILPALQRFEDSLQVTLSGDCWVDVMNQNVNKGHALQEMLARMNVYHECCMAFGDYLNDLELLEVSGESFAMDNGHPLLRERFPRSAGNNNEDGVIHTICRELNIQLEEE